MGSAPRPPGVAFYVSGHGFGHASRQIETINALRARQPGLPVVVVTSAPRWIFDRTLSEPVELVGEACDTGVAQIDSLSLDEAATLRRAEAFYATIDRRTASEADRLRRVGAGLVVGDIPPLAFRAADAAGLPSIAIGNFTWEWIYADYAAMLGLPTTVVDPIVEAHRLAQAAWRLPMHGGFAGFREVVDWPFIARRSRREPDEVRRALGLPLGEPLVLTSFGGHGLRQIPVASLPARRRFTVVSTIQGADVARAAAPPPGVRLVAEDELYGRGFRYEDLVAAADVVVTKPGYGIIAECVANGTAMVYTSRGRFAEYDVLVRDMPRYVRCAFLDQPDLLEGRWDTAVEAVLAQPPAPERPPVDGAELAADRLLALLGNR